MTQIFLRSQLFQSCLFNYFNLLVSIPRKTTIVTKLLKADKGCMHHFSLIKHSYLFLYYSLQCSLFTARKQQLIFASKDWGWAEIHQDLLSQFSLLSFEKLVVKDSDSRVLVLVNIDPIVYTAWAVDFKTPVRSSSYFLFFSFSWAASAERNNK